MSISVKIEGLRELDRQLKRLGEATEKKVLRSALSKGIQPTLKAARQRAPIADIAYTTRGGEKIEQGRLLSNIQKRVPRKSKHTRAAEVYARWSKSMPVSDPRNAWFWWWVEFGTSKMPAQPFMRPAWQASFMTSAKKAQGAITEGILKEAKGLKAPWFVGVPRS